MCKQSAFGTRLISYAALCHAQDICTYFREGSYLIADTADALLLLDDGSELPVHSAVLALHCALMDMLLSDLQLERPQRLRIVIPLPQETRAAAQAFLKLLYSPELTARGWSARNKEGLQPAELQSALRLGDKLGCAGVVSLCEAILRGQASGVSGCGVLLAQQALLRGAEETDQASRLS